MRFILPKRLLVIAALLLIISAAVTLSVRAQGDPNIPTDLDIAYDGTINDSITEKAFWDWWKIEATSGDDMVIDMIADGGLAPLLGILNSSGDLVAKSDNGEINGKVELEYKVPAAGTYTIVATRVDNESGTTTGTYSLRLRRANPPQANSDQYQDVTFRCQDAEVTTAATVLFAEDPVPDMTYRITVYGVDGFIPAIRVSFDAQNAQPFEFCRASPDNTTLNDIFTLPGEDARTIAPVNLASTVQLLVTGADKAGPITLTIASKDGAPGRYMAIIEGFTVDPSTDVDNIEVRVGPLAAKTTSITAYMVASQNSRLDPFMRWVAKGTECDDAGRGTCNQVPSFAGAGAMLHEGSGITIKGDRSDAGLLLDPGNTDPILLELSSRSGETHGPYALILIGQLPPRPS